MIILLDTNVLLRVADRQSKHHSVAFGAISELRHQGHELRTVPQNVYEFWVVATRPLDRNGLGLTAEETASRLDEFRRLVPLMRDERGVFTAWQTLVVQHGVIGKNAHDARLVAAMLRHGLNHLLTFNRQDFARYSEVTVWTPDEVVSGAQ